MCESKAKKNQNSNLESKDSKGCSKSVQSRKVRFTALSEFRIEILNYCQTNLRPKTTEIYERTLRLLIEQLGNISIKKIAPTDLECYKNKRVISASKTTTNMEIRTLKTIFGLAAKWNYLKINPATNLKQIRIDEKEYLRFSKEELTKIISLTKDEVFKTIILFAYFTGMRSSEICNLQWSDVDFENNIVFVRNSDIFSTKTGKNRRIPMNESLKIYLLNYRDLVENFNAIIPTDLVFKNNVDTKFNKDIISKRFKRIVRKAGLSEKFHFHCLRHSCFTDLVQSGANVYNVKEIAGHSSIKTTENYLHASMDELHKSMNMLTIYNYS